MAKDQALFDSICKGNKKAVEEIVRRALDEGIGAESLLMESMIPAMRQIGDRFACNEVYVPEMLVAARAMQAGLNILEPALVQAGHQPLARICIGTVKGDLHDIGKNLVTIMLKGAGYEVQDLGVDCSVDRFDKAVQAGARAVLCSAMLTTTMTYMQTVAAHFAGDPAIKVIIGGAPVTRGYATQIGAAGYGENASVAVKVVADCLGLRQ